MDQTPQRETSLLTRTSLGLGIASNTLVIDAFLFALLLNQLGAGAR